MLTPSISTFEDLPPEIRNLIYYDSLMTFNPIIVWSADRKDLRVLNSNRRYYQDIYEVDPEATRKSMEGLSPNLLRVSKMIAREAAPILYTNNDFWFRGPHEWKPVITWLRSLGNNRRLLNNVMLDVRPLHKAYQWPDGTLEAFPDGYVETNVFPRHPLLQKTSETWPEGEVEVIDPEIETIFELLGAPESGGQDTYLGMICDPGLAPGIPTLPLLDGDNVSLTRFTMDLPNLIEAWCNAHGSGPGRRPIHVYWTCRDYRFHIDKPKYDVSKILEQFDSGGWDVYDHEVEFASREFDEHGQCVTVKWENIGMGMWKRPLEGPLIAAAPDSESRTAPSILDQEEREIEELKAFVRALEQHIEDLESSSTSISEQVEEESK